MAEILADHQIKRILGEIILNGEESLIDPNGIKLRLGSEVKFHTTGEKKKLKEEKFLKIKPGESVSFSSFEEIDFSSVTVCKYFEDCSIMGFLTPTTTMMREGNLNSSTKIDPGFKGELNWSIRNGSSKDLIIEYKEPIVKLTIYLLKGEENPQQFYGDREDDSYQQTKGIKDSNRKIRANISNEDVVESNLAGIDPKKQLKEAGYPFSYIGTELTDLHGKLQTISTDMGVFKTEIRKQSTEISDKIDQDTVSINNNINSLEDRLSLKIDQVFSNKFIKAVAWVVGIFTTLTPLVIISYSSMDSNLFLGSTFLVGVLIIGTLLIINGSYKTK